MQQQAPTLTYYYDQRKKDKAVKVFPLKVSVNHVGKAKLCSTDVDATPAEWAMMEPVLKNPDVLKKLLTVVQVRDKVETTVAKVIPFSLEAFGVQWEIDKSEALTQQANAFNTGSVDIIPWFEKYGTEKPKLSVSTKRGLIYAGTLLTRYFKRESVLFNELTGPTLYVIQSWMEREGADDGKPMSISSVGIYMRYIRMVFNMAKHEDYAAIDAKFYPFGKGRNKYLIPEVAGKVSSLEDHELQHMAEVEIQPGEYADWMQKAIDFWLLLYYCNGINMKDLLLMKNSSIVKNIIYVVRAKTGHNQVNKPIQIVITEPLQKLITKWRNTDTSPDAYLFDILKQGLTDEQIHEMKNNFISQVNKYLLMAFQLGALKTETTTGDARHTLATKLANDDTNVFYIKEMLGHKKIDTTMKYIDRLNTDIKLKIAHSITQFKQPVQDAAEVTEVTEAKAA